jgi:hypothetical protein
MSNDHFVGLSGEIIRGKDCKRHLVGVKEYCDRALKALLQVENNMRAWNIDRYQTDRRLPQKERVEQEMEKLIWEYIGYHKHAVDESQKLKSCDFVKKMTKRFS